MIDSFIAEEGDGPHTYVVKCGGEPVFIIRYANAFSEDMAPLWQIMIAQDMWAKLRDIDEALQRDRPDIVAARKLARGILGYMGD